MKKFPICFLALLLAVSMVFPVFAEDIGFHDSGLPIVDQTITLRGVAKQGANVGNFNDMQFFNDMGELTNVHVEWEMIPTEAWTEKISLMFATGTDLPDILYGHSCLTTDQVVNYGGQGLLIDMKPYVEKYGENLKALTEEVPGFLKAATTPSGAIYALPAVHGIASNANSAVFINKIWLDKVGMDVPTTTEEMTAVLRAFKEAGDLNGNGVADEIPMSLLAGDSVNGYYAMFGAFGRVDNANHLLVEDGKVVFTAMEDEYKEAVKWFSQLSEEGLLDKETFTQDVATLWARIQSDAPSVGVSSFWSAGWATGAETLEEAHETWLPVPALIGPNGDQQWEKNDTSVYNLVAFCITSSCKYPEVAFRWGDYQYSHDAARDCNFGPLGTTIAQKEDGSYTFLETVNGEPNTGDVRRKYAPLNYGIFANPASRWVFEYAEFGATENEKNYDLNRDTYGAAQKDNYYPIMYQTSDEVEQITFLKNDILNFVKEKTAKWMIYGGVDEEWDAYVEQLKAMGIEEYISIYQQAYDRYAES